MGVQPGDVLAKKYRVERVLGSGGMGIVVAAVQEPIGRRVALKLLRPESSADARAHGRFIREARAAAALSGAHVAQIFDYGALDDGSPFLAMELLEGEDLAARLKHDGPLSISAAAGHALEACEALAEAHARGVVHRDLKPANLFLHTGPRGERVLKVVDFGVAKANLFGDEARALTRSDAMVGTPHYMAPEQILAASEAEERSDIWSLGVTLYELVTGALPFRGDTVGKIVARVLQDPPAEMPASTPPAFVAVVLKCLQKKADLRFADVGALARALEPFASPSSRGGAERVAALLRERPRTTRPSIEPSTGDELGPATKTDAGTVARGGVPPRGRWWLVSAIAVVAAAGTVIALRGRTHALVTTYAADATPSTRAIPPSRPSSSSFDVAPAPTITTAITPTITPTITTTITASAPPTPIVLGKIKPKIAASAAASIAPSASASIVAPSVSAPKTKASSTIDPNLEGL